MSILIGILKTMLGSLAEAVWKHPVLRAIVLASLVLGAGYVWLDCHDDAIREPLEDEIEALSDSLGTTREEYRLLYVAKTRVDSLFRVDTLKPPEIRIVRHDRTVVDSSRVDSLERLIELDRRAFAVKFATMEPRAPLDVDSTVSIGDSASIRVKANIVYFPPTRMYDVRLYPTPMITRTWLINRGYITEREIRYDWSLNLMGGWNRGPAGQLSAWFREYGAGVSVYRRYGPSYWLGGRVML